MKYTARKRNSISLTGRFGYNKFVKDGNKALAVLAIQRSKSARKILTTVAPKKSTVHEKTEKKTSTLREFEKSGLACGMGYWSKQDTKK